MGCTSSNATAPSPAIAPGAEALDARRVAERLARAHGPSGVHPRVREVVPGFDGPFFQAGLAGYSDAAMRIIARRHGCPYCVTEALLDRTLLAGGRGFAKADLGELHDNVPGGEEDHPLAGQLMGSEPREMAAAALKLVEQGKRADREYRRLAYNGALAPGVEQHLRLPGGEQIGRKKWQIANEQMANEEEPTAALRAGGHPSRGAGEGGGGERALACGSCSEDSFAAIDVNLACPVKKIASKARGGHWLAEPEGAIRILEAVREALPASVPTTVKLRRSFDDTPEMAEACLRILDAAYDMGYAWATVHARTVEQKYVGPSRWDALREIVRHVRRRDPDRVVFGSGDVWNAEDVYRMIGYTGVNAAAVARGCIGNPWVFRQARQLLAGDTPSAPSVEEQRGVLEEHFTLALAVNAGARRPEAYTGKVMRKFGIRFAEHHPRSEEVRRRFVGVCSLEDWRGVLEEFYATPAACPE
ncbi:MAG: tRNA-dihydrouridine synthase family protein [Phycisphaeraceae bacterium]|nr:tRNA-dihydrouridine synthase family protein [Phycisphaeraceae bacterium]